MGEATPTTPASSGDNPSGAGYKPGVGRPTSPRPTDAELEILHILWDGRECTVRDIRKALREKSARQLSQSTVQKALEIMADKGMVGRVGDERPLKYAALVRRSAVERLFLRHLAERVFAGRSLMGFVMRSLPFAKASRKDVEELEKHLAALKKGERPGVADREKGADSHG
jgi:BlaI family penicillinase repressor